MTRKCIAYQGCSFTIEWYFNDRGTSTALTYYNALPLESKKKIAHLFRMLGEEGKIFNKEKFRYEGDQIFAFKSAPNRFLCFFFEGSKVIITNAFEKKMEKMPAQEKTRALQAKADYLERHMKGTYYD